MTAIAYGGSFVAALRTDGTVFAWGSPWLSMGETKVPSGLTGVIALTARSYHTLALKSNGTVVAWGGNQFGQRSVPAGLSDVTAIAAVPSHSLALKRAIQPWSPGAAKTATTGGNAPCQRG